jgi:hypothetical protein
MATTSDLRRCVPTVADADLTLEFRPCRGHELRAGVDRFGEDQFPLGVIGRWRLSYNYATRARNF